MSGDPVDLPELRRLAEAAREPTVIGHRHSLVLIEALQANVVLQLLDRLEAAEQKVLWEGDLNELLHAVNGTPLMSPLLDAAVAPDDPDAHKIRVAVVLADPGSEAS